MASFLFVSCQAYGEPGTRNLLLAFAFPSLVLATARLDTKLGSMDANSGWWDSNPYLLATSEAL